MDALPEASIHARCPRTGRRFPDIPERIPQPRGSVLPLPLRREAKPMQHPQRAMTALELLITLAILSILTAVAVPA